MDDLAAVADDEDGSRRDALFDSLPDDFIEC